MANKPPEISVNPYKSKENVDKNDSIDEKAQAKESKDVKTDEKVSKRFPKNPYKSGTNNSEQNTTLSQSKDNLKANAKIGNTPHLHSYHRCMRMAIAPIKF